VKSSEKLASKTGDSVDKMKKQAEKVFSAWEKELETYSNEQLKEVGAQRLDASRQRYNSMIERMQSAGDAYDPFISSLKEQVTLLGRDMSPETLGALQSVAQELNGMAEELFVRIDAVLAEEQQDEAALAGEAG